MTDINHLPRLTAEEEEQYYTVEQSAEMAAIRAAGNVSKGTARAKKDSAMIGESGYERIEADFYPTPPENVDCLLQHVAIHPHVWECAAGKLDISHRLTEFGHSVVSSDLLNHGGAGAYLDFVGDFLDIAEMPIFHDEESGTFTQTRAIVTNPPYGDLVEKFIRHALKLTQPVKGQVAMFLRNEYDCGKGRMDLFALPPFHKKIVVTKRPRWIEGSTGSPRHNYAWFVWDWRHIGGAAGIAYSHPDFAPGPVKN